LLTKFETPCHIFDFVFGCHVFTIKSGTWGAHYPDPSDSRFAAEVAAKLRHVLLVSEKPQPTVRLFAKREFIITAVHEIESLKTFSGLGPWVVDMV
jgi:hypothetical protein